MIKETDKARQHGLMVISTWASSRKIKGMDKARTLGLMAKST